MQLGRLGNAIFRYLASTLFCILYDAKRTETLEEYNEIVSDDMFHSWSEAVLRNNDEDNCRIVVRPLNYVFDGHFQHDRIYHKYMKEIKAWIRAHPTEILRTDGDIPFFRSIDILTSSLKKYDTVVHIRLEDFLDIDYVIHPLSLKTVLDEINNNDSGASSSFCFVCKKPSTTEEQMYIDYFKKCYDITVESNDVLEDYGIMKNARTLVCSLSSISWCAALLTDNEHQTVYFPDYAFYDTNVTMKTPSVNNTVLFSYETVNTEQLKYFLNEEEHEERMVKEQKESMKLSELFDIVVPIGPKDECLVHDMIEHTKRKVHGYRNIYLVTSNDSFSIEGCVTVNEKVFPFDKNDIVSIIGNTERIGWYLQQLIKLYAGNVIDGILDNYLVIDCDTFFLKKTRFFRNNLPLYNVGTEHHAPYFEHMNKMHPSLHKCTNHSGITHHMMFQKKIVSSLFDMVESYHGDSFWKVFLSCINERDAGASEYEIYFTYLHIYHIDKFIIRKLKWQDGEKGGLLDYVSHHWYTR